MTANGKINKQADFYYDNKQLIVVTNRKIYAIIYNLKLQNMHKRKFSLKERNNQLL